MMPLRPFLKPLYQGFPAYSRFIISEVRLNKFFGVDLVHQGSIISVEFVPWQLIAVAAGSPLVMFVACRMSLHLGETHTQL